MSLTDIKIKSLRPREKRYYVPDGRGLYIAVMPTGEKYWYAREYADGKETKRSLGRYPDISLKQARELKHAQREIVPRSVTFADAAKEWIEKKHAQTVTEGTCRHTQMMLNKHAMPALGDKPLIGISPRDIYELILQKRETAPHSATHTLGAIRAVYDYAFASGLCDTNPAAQISRALPPAPKKINLSVIRTPEEASAVFAKIAAIKNERIRLYLMLLAHVFTRPSELREARWAEFDIESATWSIPAERMKMRRAHTVPLTRQTLTILRTLRELSPKSAVLFNAEKTQKDDRTMTGAAVMKTLHRAGLKKGIFTPHAFRGFASTTLNEHGFPADVIELQLAHTDKNAVRAIYNKALHMEERRSMMQWYSDFIDTLI